MKNLFLNPARMEDFLRDELGAKDIVRKGDELWFSCILPWGGHQHSTSDESSFNTDKMVYNCFKCGSGGSLLWLIEVVLKKGSSEARAIIEEQTAPEDGVISASTFRQALEEAWRQEPMKTMPRYPIRFAHGWSQPTTYLDGRGISRDVQREMVTGLIEDTSFVKGQEITQTKLVLPHIFRKKLRGWTTRKLDDRQIGPKWDHSEDFPKSTSLYNYDNAHNYNWVYVVESPMSVLWLKTCGIANVVATFGAEVNAEQIELLASWSQVVSFPDADTAGYKALARMDKRKGLVGLVPSLVKLTRLWVIEHGRTVGEDGVDIFNEKDPADYTPEEIAALVETKIPAQSFHWYYEPPEPKKKVRSSPARTGEWD